jgi:hypothetical protein
MGPPSNASAGGGLQEFRRRPEKLKQEPETDKGESVDLDEWRDEQDWDEHDDPGQWKQAHLAPENAADCARGA